MKIEGAKYGVDNLMCFLTDWIAEQQVLEKLAVFLYRQLGKITKKITMIDKTTWRSYDCATQKEKEGNGYGEGFGNL